jgi:tetratricopeptide (TPR) repeat protein
MYLKGSKWSMTQRKKPVRIGRIFILAVLVGAIIYINQVIVPITPPLFIPTPTATREPESYVTEAQNLETEGKFSQAILAYQLAIEVDPKNPSNYIAMARLQIYTNQFAEAETNAKNAMLLNANNSMASAILGWAQGFQGDYLEGLAALSRAIQLDPNNAIAYAYQAEVLALQNQAGTGTLTTLQEAIDASRQAQILGPNLVETHRARGVVLEMTANYEEAAREFEAAVAQNGNIADLHLALGRNYRALQQYDKAIEEFTRANSLNPTDPIPDTYIARTYFTVGEYAKAIQYAQQAIIDAPSDPYMYGNLGTMYYRNRQYQEAVDVLRLAIRGGTSETGEEIQGLPLDYGRIAEYYFTYGLALARRGECSEALQIVQLLQQGVPSDETAIFNADEMVNICTEVMNATPTPRLAQTTTP